MGLIGKIWVRLGLDNSEYKRGIKDTEKQTDQFSAGIKRMGAAMLAAFSIQKIMQWGAAAIKAYNEQAMALAKVEAVLKSTGNAAGLTSKELQRYATELQKTTMFGDEATLEAMARLATFKSISKDIFKATIASAQDLATVMGGDLNGAILQLGKALEAPEIGLTMLRRSGVSFSTEQIEQIKKLVAEGKKHEAQLVMLAEVQNQFGGAAKAAGETAAGAWRQVSNAIGDLMEVLGSGVESSKGFANSIKGWFEVLTDVAMSKRLNFFEKLTAFMGGNMNAFRIAREEAQQEQAYWDGVNKNVEAVMGSIKDLAAAQTMLNSLKKDNLSDQDKELKKQLEAYIAKSNTAKIEEGLIPTLLKQIELKNELLLIETDPYKIRAINDEIAVIEKRLAALKMTTAEYAKMNQAKNRITLPSAPSGASSVPTGKVTTEVNTSGLDALVNMNYEEGLAKYKAFVDKLEDETERAKMIANDFGNSVAIGFSDGMKVLMDALVSGEKVDSDAMVAAILEPFAQMSIRIGEMAIANGVAAIALKQLAKVPALSIAAGAALVSLGQLAMAGLGRMAAGGSQAKQSGNSTTFTGGAGGFNTASQVQAPQLNLVGVLKGSDIYLSVQKESDKRVR